MQMGMLMDAKLAPVLAVLLQLQMPSLVGVAASHAFC